MGLYKEYIGFGIAGNFALHLDQAGEAFVVLYHKKRDNLESIRFCVEQGLFKPSMSVLHQKVVV